MKTKFIALLVALFAITARSAPVLFESFEVSKHDSPSLKYRFSKSAATSNDPVVISAVGRKLQRSDREIRVDLQKVWLNKNVPKEFRFAGRSQVFECGQKLAGEFHHCDQYVFTDLAGVEFTYHIYIGNWP